MLGGNKKLNFLLSQGRVFPRTAADVHAVLPGVGVVHLTGDSAGGGGHVRKRFRVLASEAENWA